MKELDPIFVFKNPTFRKTIFFENSKIIQLMILSIITTIIVTGFPLITQFYIKYLYPNGTLNEIFIYTTIFTILYIIKIIIDIKVEKQEIIFFLKLEKLIKEKILEKFSKSPGHFLKTEKSLFTKHLGLYILLTKTVYRNILEITKIIIMGTIIFFFDINLFYYFLISVPFFFIFYFLIKLNLLEKKVIKKKRFESDFGLLLNKIITFDKNKIMQIGLSDLKSDFEKKKDTRTNHIGVNQIVTSFINFYRLFYLAYFGVLILTQNIEILNLIVGLLFLTMLIKSTTNLLKSISFYRICSPSFFKITALMKEESEKQ